MSGIFSALKTAISRSGSPDDLLPPSNILLTQEELCLACPDPCHDHQQFPSYLKIDNTTPLLGSTKPYSRHVLIATGKSDWLSHIDEENGTVAAALLSHMNKVSPPFRILTTNTSLTATHSTLPGSTDVVVLPDNILVSNVTTSNVAQFYDLFLATPLPSKADSALPDLKGNTELVVTKNIYTSMILLCSHRRRDKRCGVTAPILAQEFDHVLRQRDIHEGEGGTALVMVSHIGGKHCLLLLYPAMSPGISFTLSVPKRPCAEFVFHLSAHPQDTNLLEILSCILMKAVEEFGTEESTHVTVRLL
jgi:hypothetical protein